MLAIPTLVCSHNHEALHCRTKMHVERLPRAIHDAPNARSLRGRMRWRARRATTRPDGIIFTNVSISLVNVVPSGIIIVRYPV